MPTKLPSLLLTHWLHLLAVATWVGGIVMMNLAILPALSAVRPEARMQFLPRLLRRYLVVAWIALMVTLLTGLDQALQGRQMWEPSLWSHTPVGHLLLSKLAIWCILTLMLLRLTWSLYPQIRDHAMIHAAHAPDMIHTETACGPCAHLLGRVRRLMRLAFALALLLFFLAARLRFGG